MGPVMVNIGQANTATEQDINLPEGPVQGHHPLTDMVDPGPDPDPGEDAVERGDHGGTTAGIV